MSQPGKLALVRATHTIIYLVMASASFAAFYAGVAGAVGVWVWVAVGLVLVESAVFTANRFRCPFTALAAKYQAGGPHVADTYLPETVTRFTFAFFGPLIAVALTLLAARWLGILHVRLA